jgi:predicted dithiol-disulfide oxidoreductase (DUF899 family)
MVWSSTWNRFHWVSSKGDFNFDYHVSFTEEDRSEGAEYNYVPLSAARGTGGAGSQRFSKDEDGAIFHTYSRYAQTKEDLLTAYQLLDLVPKGRDEAGLEWPVQCVRRHDEYG